MIDTVRFRAIVSDELFEQMRKKSVEYLERDNTKQAGEIIRFIKTNIELGTYDRNINLFIRDNVFKQVYIELSLPKLVYGENVHLFYPAQVVPTLIYLLSRLVKRFPSFPPYEQWELVRVDLCYAWKFPTQQRAQAVLDMIKLLNYPRKNKHVEKTTVYFGSKKSSIKFYLKEPEVLVHDYNELIKSERLKMADDVLRASDGVLRFEITIRHEQLQNWFKIKQLTYRVLLNGEILLERLNYVLLRVLDNRTPQSMDNVQFMHKLSSAHGHAKAADLYAFDKSWNSPDPQDRELLKKQYHPSTIWRKKKAIEKAGGGIAFNLIDFDFNLAIPSHLVVNDEPLPTGLGSVSNTT